MQTSRYLQLKPSLQRERKNLIKQKNSWTKQRNSSMHRRNRSMPDVLPLRRAELTPMRESLTTNHFCRVQMMLRSRRSRQRLQSLRRRLLILTAKRKNLMLPSHSMTDTTNSTSRDIRIILPARPSMTRTTRSI